MKRKTRDLEEQVREKDLEIAKMRDKTSDKAQENMKDELRRAYDVLRHLKKKVGAHAFNEEYGIVMNEIREALGMPQVEKRSKRKRSLAAAKDSRKQSMKVEENAPEPLSRSDDEGDESRVDEQPATAGEGLINSEDDGAEEEPPLLGHEAAEEEAPEKDAEAEN